MLKKKIPRRMTLKKNRKKRRSKEGDAIEVKRVADVEAVATMVSTILTSAITVTSS